MAIFSLIIKLTPVDSQDDQFNAFIRFKHCSSWPIE